MAHIIAGRLQQQQQVQHAIAKLVEAGFSEDSISSFYVNPPGQHDLFYLGGDRDKSPGAKKSDEGALRGVAAGGVIGATIGVAGIPVVGPISPAVGTLVGAHIGSLIGGLSKMKERGESEESSQGEENTEPQRQSGMVVAVSVAETAKQNAVITLLQSLGADQIESAEGTITNGEWLDFNSLASPNLFDPANQHRP